MLTADAPPVRPVGARPAERAQPDGSAPKRTPLGRDLAATAALILYSGAVAAGFGRVFSGWEFLSDLLVLVVGGHGVSLVLRRLRLPAWSAIPTVAVVLVWLMVLVRYRSTLAGPFPTASTWRLFDLELDLVRAQFPTAVAPVIYDAGWAALAGLAVLLVVFLADTFAFRAHARGEALVPGAVLFVFVAALGSERLRATLAVAVVVTGVLAVVALRYLHDRARRVARGDRPGWRLVPTALATAAVIGGLAAAVAPRLPGHGAEPWYDTTGGGDDVTEVISPLVDIRSRLTNRGNTELFRVNADRESYWRQTTLAEFDGSRFGLPSRALEQVDADQAFDPPEGVRTRQQIQVLGLGGPLIPAAADPVQASGTSADGRQLDLRLNRDTNTLLTSADHDPGDLFTIVSARPEVDPDMLRAAGSANPPDEIFLELPDDFPADVTRAAVEVVADAPTSYDQAIALQTWFRSEFTYSLEVQAGHSIDAIESFLRIRVGYCEQFAVTFAAMGRALGIPTRVAVGYTPGVLDSSGWYTVRGRNAHAWPEVWFDGIGWVAFEPTPGRGSPGSEGYTGVAPQQDTSTGGDPSEIPAPDQSTAPRPTTPGTVVPPPNPAEPTVPVGAEGLPTDPFGSLAPVPAGDTPTSASGNGSDWTWLVITAVIAAVLAAPWVVRRLRQAPHGDPEEQVLTAWRRAQRAALRGGVAATPSMTSRRWAALTGDALPMAARPMTALAELVDLVAYAPPGALDRNPHGITGQTLAGDSRLWSQQIEAVVDDLLPRRQRMLRYFVDYRA